jgi:hypothetical protein
LVPINAIALNGSISKFGGLYPDHFIFAGLGPTLVG